MRVLATFLYFVFLIINSNLYAQVHVEYKLDLSHQYIADLIREDGLIERQAKFIEKHIKLTVPISITVGADDGPAFDLDDSQMLIPYSFIDETIKLFRADGYESEQAETYALDVLEHTLFHEFGHGLIDQLQIPFTGKEEDAVDELAGLLVIATNQQAGEVILSTADSFRLYHAQINQLVEEDFSAQHSLDIQRFYNLICMTYASDPDDYFELIEQSDVTMQRAQQCLEDYPRQVKNWLVLMRPHLRSPESFSRLFNH